MQFSKRRVFYFLEYRAMDRVQKPSHDNDDDDTLLKLRQNSSKSSLKGYNYFIVI
jgi:hypothetical protein